MTTDIVIPVFNQFGLTSQCIDCVLHQGNVGKVIVVDDASTDAILVYYLMEMSAGGHIHYIRNARNIGFVGTANRGMECVESEYGLLVNSDTVPIGDNALISLIAQMHDVRYHVAGPKLLFMNGSKHGKRGTIQHAGVGFNPEGIPYHPFMHLHRDTKAACIRKKVTAVTGAVFAVRMDVWNALGGFDEAFAPGVYEDVDFCLKAGKVLYVPQSEWLHRMHGSQVDGIDLFDHEEDHLKLLLRRWGIRCDEELYYGI